MDPDGRRECRHRGLRPKVCREVPGASTIFGNYRDRAAVLQLPRSQVLGRLSINARLGIRPLHGSRGKGNSPARSAPARARSSCGKRTRGFGSKYEVDPSPPGEDLIAYIRVIEYSNI